MQWTEAVLRTLRTGGFSVDLTHHAYHAIDSHITGFTLWVVSMPFETHEESSTWPRRSCLGSRPRRSRT